VAGSECKAAMAGGGARRLGKRRRWCLRVGDVKLEGDAGVPFIGQVRRWNGEQGGGGVNGGAVLGSPASYVYRRWRARRGRT
jgi:hypothetical protein